MLATADVSVENSPRITIPFRFILTAPLFGMLFSIIFLLYGPGLIGSRWDPALIGTLHLINIGVLMMIVTGVLFQVLPVVGGVQFPWKSIISRLIYLSLVAGGAIYFIGFFLLERQLLLLAGVVLSVGLLPYLSLLVVGIFRLHHPAEPIRLLRYSVLFLLLVMGLGISLLMGWGSSAVQLHREWTDIHAVWGLGGWFTLLLMGLSFQMIPMFQVTPDFPPWLRRWGVPVTALLLLSWGVLSIMQLGQGLSALLLAAAAGVMVLYGMIALWVLHNRKRKVFDATVRFWQLAFLGMASGSLLLIFFLLSGQVIPGWLAILWIFGFLLPMLSGTLLKIAPFLVFLHLQQKVIKDPEQMANLVNIPNLFQILPTRRARTLLLLFLLSMVSWGGALLSPLLAHLTGLLLLLYFSWMGWIVFSCYRTYLMKLSEFGIENT